MDGSGHTAVQEFLRLFTGGPSNAYLRGQIYALSTPEAEYWEGYGLRKGQANPHAWNRLGGKVLDLTWHNGRANADTVYLGVPVGTDFRTGARRQGDQWRSCTGPNGDKTVRSECSKRKTGRVIVIKDKLGVKVRQR